MHARDPSVQFIIAAWWEPDNPMSKRIVQELDGKAALWDVHVGGDDLHEGRKVDALFTRMEKLVREWAPNTPLKACVLEENGGRHDLQRALGHAAILNATQRHGDFVLLDCPANCLQPWQQNDNDWDQGQVFFTSSQVWGMPPYYAQQMASANHLPLPSRQRNRIRPATPSMFWPRAATTARRSCSRSSTSATSRTARPSKSPASATSLRKLKAPR